jgi:hypothetical protein
MFSEDDKQDSPAAPLVGELTVSIETLARGYATVAMAALVKILQNPKDYPANAVVNAAKEILDRGYGKPTQTTVQVPARQVGAQRYARHTDEDLLRIMNGEEPELKALPPPDDPTQALLQAIQQAAAPPPDPTPEYYDEPVRRRTSPRPKSRLDPQKVEAIQRRNRSKGPFGE